MSQFVIVNIPPKNKKFCRSFQGLVGVMVVVKEMLKRDYEFDVDGRLMTRGKRCEEYILGVVASMMIKMVTSDSLRWVRIS